MLYKPIFLLFHNMINIITVTWFYSYYHACISYSLLISARVIFYIINWYLFIFLETDVIVDFQTMWAGIRWEVVSIWVGLFLLFNVMVFFCGENFSFNELGLSLHILNGSKYNDPAFHVHGSVTVWTFMPLYWMRGYLFTSRIVEVTINRKKP